VVAYVTKDADYSDSRTRDGFLTRWGNRLKNPKRFVIEVQALTRKKRFFGNLQMPRTYAQREAWVAPWAK
jgi:hypothetical protein